MSERIEHKYTDEVVCPWCGYKQSESYELFESHYDETTDTECHECAKPFMAEKIVTVEYSTYIDPCPGHKLEIDSSYRLFKDVESLAKSESFGLYCTVCHETYYTWNLPDGKYPKLKEGTFELDGFATQVMQRREELKP